MLARLRRISIASTLVIAGVAVMPATPSYGLGSVAVVSPPSSPAFAPSSAHNALDEDAPDPDVARFGNTYYAYTTGTTWGNHIGVLRSSSPNSGFHTITGHPFGSSAFPSIPANQSIRPWQVNSTQNAPGVFFRGGRYVMYYTARTVSGHGGHYCLSVATASGPAGPFADHSNSPWLCMDAQGGVIDPSPFVDAGGNAWLYFKTYDDVNNTTQPAQIYVVRLSANGLQRAAAPTVVLSQTQLSSGNETVENPQMSYLDGTYVLLESRGQWNSSNYRQAYATCAGPTGPCSEGQPVAILTSYGDVRGPGGGTIFRDPSGGAWLAYQGWNGAAGCTSYSGASCARKLFVARLQLNGGPPSGGPLRVPCKAVQPIAGYRLVATDGGIFSFGNQQFCGSTGNVRLNQPIITMVTTRDGGGYWLVASDGGIFAFGNAHFYGSTGGMHLNQPIVGMARTASGHGYWLVARDGGIFAFGDAHFYGSTGGIHLNQPIVGMARTASGNGYWLVASDGGMFSFGDAHFFGSTGGIHLNQPIVGMARTAKGNGYWLVATDGGMFSFGDAHFYGSTGGIRLNQPIVGMARTSTGRGYWLVATDGGIFAFGDAHFYGSTGGIRLNQPIVGMS